MKHTKIFLLLSFVITLYGCKSSSNPSKWVSPDLQTDSTGAIFVELPIHSQVEIDAVLSISFDEVVGDSRCPEGADCIWMGDGEVQITLSSPNESKSVNLHTALDSRETTFEKYKIELSELAPYPHVDKEINPDEYTISLKIQYGFANNSIVLITFDQLDLIKKDVLTVKSLSIENDSLIASLNYTGRCKEHEIQLYGFKEIVESQPPQMRVQFSHNANNDMCEAYISEDKAFDLKPLKDLLTEAKIEEIYLNIYSPNSTEPIVQILFRN